MRMKQKSRRNKKIFIVLSIAVIALLTLFFLEKRQIINLFGEDNSNTSTDGINYDPPTDEEKQAGDQQKFENSKPEGTETPSSDGDKKSVNVIITDAGQYEDIIEVRAFMPSHYEDGTCTITLRKDSHLITKETPAYKDVSTTICTNPLIKRSDLPTSGTWQVTVSYESEGGIGTSAPQDLEVK